jgi:2-keto-4-pentenoate hydratase/2-oxohepta-3-ene-1,7-dioic acid hydratase in catechol pathway
MDHIREMNHEVPKNPVIFLKPPSAVIPHEGEILLPKTSRRVDYEGELALVISKKGKDIQKDEWEEYVMGFMCFNDVTARDLQQEDGQWTRAKSFDTFAPMGPFIVDVDPFNLEIITKVNEKVRQQSNTSNLIFHVPELIEFISHIMTLEKGDVISTGTPSGVGPLNKGDVVEVMIEKIGTLRNYVR